MHSERSAFAEEIASWPRPLCAFAAREPNDPGEERHSPVPVLSSRSSRGVIGIQSRAKVSIVTQARAAVLRRRSTRQPTPQPRYPALQYGGSESKSAMEDNANNDTMRTAASRFGNCSYPARYVVGEHMARRSLNAASYRTRSSTAPQQQAPHHLVLTGNKKCRLIGCEDGGIAGR